MASPNLIAAAVSSTEARRRGQQVIINLETAAAETLGEILTTSPDDKLRLKAATEILNMNQRYAETDIHKADLNRSLAPSAIAAGLAGLAALGAFMPAPAAEPIKEAEPTAPPLIINPSDLANFVAENIQAPEKPDIRETFDIPDLNATSQVHLKKKAINLNVMAGIEGTNTRAAQHRSKRNV
jgi:hypothetical protein